MSFAFIHNYTYFFESYPVENVFYGFLWHTHTLNENTFVPFLDWYVLVSAVKKTHLHHSLNTLLQMYALKYVGAVGLSLSFILVFL